MQTEQTALLKQKFSIVEKLQLMLFDILFYENENMHIVGTDKNSVYLILAYITRWLKFSLKSYITTFKRLNKMMNLSYHTFV